MSYHNISPSVNTESGSQSAIINNIYIDTSNLRAGSSSRVLEVSGDPSAIFSLTVTRVSDGRSYDFTTDTFESSVTSRSRLRNQSPGIFRIKFPASSGDTYKIIVTAEPHYNTKLGSFYRDDVRYSVDIPQVDNAVVTFVAKGQGFEGQSQTLSTTGSKATSYSSAYDSVIFSEMQVTVPEAAADAGYFITSPNSDKDLNNGVFDSGVLSWDTVAADHETTAASDHDAGATSTALILNSVDGLYVGMTLSSIQSAAVTSTPPVITAIDTDALTVTLSAAQTWASGKDMTFRAYGKRAIEKAIGIGVSLSNGSVRLGQLTKVFRADITSSIAAGGDIAITDTFGIAKGATLRMRGLDKSASGECLIGNVTQHASAGSFVISAGVIKASSAFPIRGGSVMYIDDSSNIVFISGTIELSRYPAANQTINIDMDKILTQGTAS